MERHSLHRRNFLLHLQTRPGYDGPVLLKQAAHQPPIRTHLDQLHNEYAITRQLADVPGVRPALAKEGSESQPVLLLEYIQGQSLAELIRTASLDLREKLRIAVDVAGILSHIHAQQVMHKDINSSNILIADDAPSLDGVPCGHGGPSSRGEVYIIDFGTASTIQQESPPRLASDDALVGTLAYISPEQTGRMNRPVDYRTDLYSLGVTLYELFTGQLPFQSGDALEMIHCHIARPPIPPVEISQDVPLPVSDIILKLLAKNAEDRYQTAQSLQADLEHCLDQYKAAGQIHPFELGRDDFTGRLQIPAKLYGRETEIAQLLETFERTALGGAEVLLVTGYAGVGKTSLVHEIQRPIMEKRGYFVEGKFDQYQRNIPYSAWGQSLGALVDHWLSESQSSIDAWKDIILEEVGQNGQVLIDLIPNLEHIIGPQPEGPKLGGVEAQNRFNYLFQRFISAVSRPDHPLVVFLDDLHWIDPASLKLFDVLLGDPGCEHVLVFGAYRDNEVDASHPLMLELNRLKETELAINQFSVGNLSLENVNTLLSDSLRTPPERCLPLAQLIHGKTGGNAFFTRQLLHTLADDGFLYFDSEGHHWRWDISRLNDLNITENVVELMVDRIQRLPAASQDVLQVAACLGPQFDPALLHLVSEKSQEETRLALQAALEEGFILLVESSGRFAHDRIQQAAYSFIPDQEKPLLHRHIGQVLLEETPVQAQEGYLFDIVGHLNRGSALIEKTDERLELAELNLKAAETALRATAYAAALDYARAAIHLLGDDGWQKHYQLMLRLHLLAAEAAYLNVDYDLSEQHIEAILASARSEVDQASAYVIRIESYNTQHQLQAAIDTGLSALQVLGVPLQEALLSGLTLEILRDLPIMSDQRGQAATQILAACFHPVYVARPELLPATVLTALHLTITHGLTPASCLAIVAYAASLVWPDDIESAYQLGRLGLQLIERLEDKRYLCQVKAVFDSFLLHWKVHFVTVKGAIQQGIQIGFDTGNTSYLGTNLISDTYLNVLVGNPLAQAQEAMERNLRQLEQVRERYRAYDAYLWTQYVAHLRGMAEEPTQFTGPYFDEVIDLPAAKADNIHNTILHFHTLKCMLHYHLGDSRAAYEHARQAEPQVPLAASTLNLHPLPFYQSLALFRLPERRTEHDEKLDENVGKLRLWAEHAPMNFQHKLDMVLAERKRVAGDVGAAIGHYERAIAGAKQNEFAQDEALANELYGRFWHERGNDNIAQLYLSEAHALYRRWGAGAITAHLEGQYPHWLKSDAVDVGQTADLDVSLSRIHPGLDLYSVLKTAEAIAGELDLEKLLHTMMAIIMENAGAQRAFLIIERDGQWLIEAEADVETDEVRILQSIDIREGDMVSAGIVHYVAHTGEIVLLGNAASAGQFVQDPHIRRRQVGSVLCMPLINRGRLTGILYLENNLAPSVFTSERVELLRLLSSQMAISIDHARLYDHLEDEVAERTQALIFAEKQIRALFENSQIGISLTTVEGKILVANEALLRMTGYSEEEMLQRNVPEFYVDPEQRDELLAMLAESPSVNDFGVKIKRSDGTHFYANLNVSKILREGQEIILSLIDDVTEQVQLREHLQQEVAERKQAEQELKIQIALVDGLLDATAETVAIFDANTLQYIKWNRAYRDITGYSDDEIATKRPATDFLDEADYPRAEAAIEKVMREEQVPPTKLTHVSKDGSRTPMEYTGALTRDAEGNPLYVIAIGRDITEREQVEQQLRFQANLLDAVEQAVIVVDKEGHVVYWNPFAERLYGWSAEEAMGRMTNELIVDDYDRQPNPEIGAYMLAGESWSGEYLARRRDGTLLPIATTITPITDAAGELTHTIGVAVDITERLQAEEALRAARQFAQSSLDSLSAHIAILDESGTIIGLNDAWRQFAQDNHMAWPNYGLGQNYLTAVDAVSEDDAAAARQAAAGIRAVMAGERDYFQLEYPCHSPTEERWFAMHVTRFESEDGVRAVTAHEDITQGKQAEQALLKSNQSLNQRLEELSTLNLIGQTVSTVTDLPDALDIVVAAVTNVFDAAGASLVLLNEDRSETELLASFNRQFPVSSLLGKGKTRDDAANSVDPGIVFPIQDRSLAQELLVDGQSVVIPDAQVDPRLATARAILQAREVQCLLLAPLLSHGEVIGIMSVSSDQPGREFTRDEVLLAETIAGQIAGAIETARLFEQVEQSAVTGERNRLARELHDAVTQTLFSASVIAEATPRIWRKNPTLAERNLNQITSMLHGALAEMRTMLLELRPDAIRGKTMAELLQVLIEANQPRINAPISLTVDGNDPLPPDITIALHRVAQEALSNVGKHAEAGEVEVKLVCDQSHVTLSIRDSGRGFDPQNIPAGHFGLETMGERLERIGGTLSIDSKPGKGTVISAFWSEQEGRSPYG